MNPVRIFGPARDPKTFDFYSYMAHIIWSSKWGSLDLKAALLAKEWNYHWVWWVGDFAGAVLAVIIVKLVYVPGIQKWGFEYFRPQCMGQCSATKMKIQSIKRASMSQVYFGGTFMKSISTKNKPILQSMVFKYRFAISGSLTGQNWPYYMSHGLWFVRLNEIW